MQIGVVGINYKLANLKLREELAKACQKWFSPFQSVHDKHFFVLLSTCNRTEIYFSSEELSATHTYLLNVLQKEVEEEFNHKLYSYFGVNCFTHLTRVTLGLDSAIIAETEIQGQVKSAYESTTEYHLLPYDLHFLFQKALAIAKKLRCELQLGRGMPNLEHAILQAGRQLFSHAETASLLFVGASEINRKIISFLRNKNFHNLTLCNRSDTQGKKLAVHYNMHYLSWKELHRWQEYEWIIFGTKSTDYLVKRNEISNCMISHKLILDLCVPRNVDPKLGQDARITLLNIDHINSLLTIRTRSVLSQLEKAEEHVMASTRAHAERFATKSQSKLNIATAGIA